jgi:CO/xanthine dehydrogenase Mo-binding subunit
VRRVLLLVGGHAVPSCDTPLWSVVSEVPRVDVRLIEDRAAPALGVGEIVQGPVAAAIANGLAAALGLRVRDLPLTRERILAAASV